MESDDGATGGAAVQHAHPGNPRQSLPQPLGQRPGSGLGCFQAHLERVPRRRGHAELEGVGAFPLLEAARGGDHLVVVRAGPVGAAHVHKERMVAPAEGALGGVQKADAARAAQELAAGGGEVVALEARHLYRHLAHRLAGVHQVGHPEFLTDRTHGLGVLHQPGVRGDPRDCHRLDLTTLEHGPHPLRINPALGEVRRVEDLHPAPAGQRQVLDLIGGVVAEGGDQSVAGLPVDGAQGQRKGTGGAAGDGDLVGPGAHQRREVSVPCGDLAGPCIGSLVPAHLRFELEVLGDRSVHHIGHQGGAGVVQVVAVGTAGGGGAPGGEVWVGGHGGKVDVGAPLAAPAWGKGRRRGAACGACK